MVVMEGATGENQNGVSSSLNECDLVVKELMQVIDTIGSYGGFRKTQRKECLNMVRRLKLLVPLLEEIRELDGQVSSEALNCLANLKKPLLAAKKLLKDCNYGSKIYLVSCHFMSVKYLLNFVYLLIYFDI